MLITLELKKTSASFRISPLEFASSDYSTFRAHSFQELVTLSNGSNTAAKILATFVLIVVVFK